MAKHYYIAINPLNLSRRDAFYLRVFLWLLKNDAQLKNIQRMYTNFHVFCGERKLNVITNEACLLKLEDTLFIYRSMKGEHDIYG